MWRLESPLALRRSFRILQAHSPTPFLTFLRLLWPIPWRLPCRLPEGPRYLHDNPKVVFDRNADVYELTLIPLWRWRDTPQRSFCRMYENFSAEQGVLLGYETEYFFKHRDPAWALHLLPDPCDDDPERYAVIASLLEDLVDAFNWRLELGLRRGAPMVDRADDGTRAPFVAERCPEWVHKVPPLKKRLVLHDPIVLIDTVEDPYRNRNIVAGTGYLTTV